MNYKDKFKAQMKKAGINSLDDLKTDAEKKAFFKAVDKSHDAVNEELLAIAEELKEYTGMGNLPKSVNSNDVATALKNIEYLKGDKEAKIQQSLSQFPEVIERAAENYEPHLICYYLRNLAYNFHSYYNSEKILVENEKELQAKLFMLSAIKQVIFNGLKILGIKSPESM